jgi:Putative DNA-binding domain
MLPMNVGEVSAEHISALVNERTAERRTLEYKERLPGGSDEDKREFLADVCSFANLVGGDIIYGIRDERDGEGKPTGAPESVVGLAGLNLSAERERLESIIRNGIQPRILNVQTAEIQVEEHGAVLLLRIARSWIKPHMVTFRGTSRFYSRHSTGKYQLDVQEIGQAFAEQRSLGERMLEWRTERLARVLGDEGPVNIEGPSRFLLHFVPASALAGQRSAGLWPVPNTVRNLLRPSSYSGAVWRYNIDGFLVATFNEAVRKYSSYVQLFRDGRLEYGDGDLLNTGKRYGAGREWAIPSGSFEEKLIDTFGNALLVINRIGIEGPVYFSAALTGVKGMRLSLSNPYGIGVQHTFDRDVIQTPEVEIGRMEPRPYRDSLLPVVDSIWQANGYEGTQTPQNWGLDANRKPLLGK